MYRILRCINWETEPAKGLRVMNGWRGARPKLFYSWIARSRKAIAGKGWQLKEKGTEPENPVI